MMLGRVTASFDFERVKEATNILQHVMRPLIRPSKPHWLSCIAYERSTPLSVTASTHVSTSFCHRLPSSYHRPWCAKRHLSLRQA